MHTLKERPTDGIKLNDVAKVRLSCHRALYVDDYERNRETGAFIVIDSLTNNTVAAGMIILEGADQSMGDVMKELHAESAMEPKTFVSPTERMERFGQKGATVWLHGVPGSGRWTLAYALERKLFDQGRTATVVSPVGEDLRSMISGGQSRHRCRADQHLRVPEPDPKRPRRAGEAHRRRPRRPGLRQHRPRALQGASPRRRLLETSNRPEDPDITVALDEVRIDKAVDMILEALEARGQFEE